MKTIEELANVIVVRNHLSELLNGTRNVIKKGEVGQLSALIQKLDSDIVKSSLELFKDAAIVVDDTDIKKRIAEAKAKMLAAKVKPTDVSDDTEDEEEDKHMFVPAPVEKAPRRSFKKVAKADEPTSE